jgi:hypothetical protein
MAFLLIIAARPQTTPDICLSVFKSHLWTAKKTGEAVNIAPSTDASWQFY